MRGEGGVNFFDIPWLMGPNLPGKPPPPDFFITFPLTYLLNAFYISLFSASHLILIFLFLFYSLYFPKSEDLLYKRIVYHEVSVYLNI